MATRSPKAAKPTRKPRAGQRAKGKAPTGRARSAAAAQPKDSDDAMRIVRADADGVEVGGFAALELVGWHRERLIITCPILGRTAALDLGATPSLQPLAEAFAQACGEAADGLLAVLLGLSSAARHLRVFPPSLHPSSATDISFGRKPLEFAAVGFFGERLLAIPGYLGTHRRYGHVHAAVPYVEERGALRPVPGLTREAGGAAPELTGVVAWGGAPLLVWGGRGFRWTGEALERASGFELSTSHTNAGLTTAPTAGGCFAVSSRQLVELSVGGAPRIHLAGQAVRLVRPGPEGVLLLESISDGPKPPGLMLYDPARRTTVEVEVPDDLHPMTAHYVRARQAIAMLARASGGTAGRRIAFLPIAPWLARLR